MKLGANSVLFGGFDLRTAFEAIARAGYDGIELSAIEGMSEHLVLKNWRSLAPTDALSTWAWIALRHEIDYRRALKLGETAHGRTWVSDTAEGPRFDRFVRIDAGDRAMCAQVRTTWVLIEQASGRPRRVPPWMLEMFA